MIQWKNNIYEINCTREYTAEGEHHDESLLSKSTQSFHNKIPNLFSLFDTFIYRLNASRSTSKKGIKNGYKMGESNPLSVPNPIGLKAW